MADAAAKAVVAAAVTVGVRDSFHIALLLQAALQSTCAVFIAVKSPQLFLIQGFYGYGSNLEGRSFPLFL